MSILPEMVNLEDLMILPGYTRMSEAIHLHTDTVVQAASRCPSLLTPLFLRYPKLLISIPVSDENPSGLKRTRPVRRWNLYCQLEHSV